MFSHPKSRNRITNLLTTEPLFSYILKMNRGSLHTKSFRRIHLAVCKYRLTKNDFSDPKRFRALRETAPRAQLNFYAEKSCLLATTWQGIYNRANKHYKILTRLSSLVSHSMPCACLIFIDNSETRECKQALLTSFSTGSVFHGKTFITELSGVINF